MVRYTMCILDLNVQITTSDNFKGYLLIIKRKTRNICTSSDDFHKTPLTNKQQLLLCMLLHVSKPFWWWTSFNHACHNLISLNSHPFLIYLMNNGVSHIPFFLSLSLLIIKSSISSRPFHISATKYFESLSWQTQCYSKWQISVCNISTNSVPEWGSPRLQVDWQCCNMFTDYAAVSSKMKSNYSKALWRNCYAMGCVQLRNTIYSVALTRLWLQIWLILCD